MNLAEEFTAIATKARANMDNTKEVRRKALIVKTVQDLITKARKAAESGEFRYTELHYCRDEELEGVGKDVRLALEPYGLKCTIETVTKKARKKQSWIWSAETERRHTEVTVWW